MKDIVNKWKSIQTQSKFQLSDGTVTTNKPVISSKFDEFFCEHSIFHKLLQQNWLTHCSLWTMELQATMI